MPVLATSIALIIVACLPGSLSASTLLRRFRGVDTCKQGCGNAGGTNVSRARGKRVRILRWRS